MSHLTLEALARLLDEVPSEGEQSHLAECALCREELTELRGQTEALAALPDMVPPPDVWPELRERLMEERLVRPAPGHRFPGALRAAAAVVLFACGGLLGYGVRGAASGPEVDAPVAGLASEAGVEASPRQVDGGAEQESGGEAFEETTGQRSTRLASATDPQSLRQVEEAQEAFLSALDRYMGATGSSASDPATRLATLDNIVLTTAEALNEAPADPVINSFHLTALAQRNALFRQITASPDPVF